jgi:hypothetical protein
MTRSVMGPDGEQQRVTVERDFRNEAELNAFLKQFGESLNKTTSNNKSNSKSNKSKNRSNSQDLIKSPGLDLSIFRLLTF